MTKASPSIPPDQEHEAERQLVIRAQAGDPEAISALYNANRPEVLRYLRSRVADRHLVEDLAQDVFVRALGSLSAYVWNGKPFIAWLMRIARNLVIDHFKLCRTRNELPTDQLADGDELAPDPEVLALGAAERQQVRDALLALVPSQRRVLVLQVWGGLTHKQIVALTGMASVGAVKTMRHRGLARMRGQLSGLGRERGCAA